LSLVGKGTVRLLLGHQVLHRPGLGVPGRLQRRAQDRGRVDRVGVALPRPVGQLLGDGPGDGALRGVPRGDGVGLGQHAQQGHAGAVGVRRLARPVAEAAVGVGQAHQVLRHRGGHLRLRAAQGHHGEARRVRARHLAERAVGLQAGLDGGHEVDAAEARRVQAEAERHQHELGRPHRGGRHIGGRTALDDAEQLGRLRRQRCVPDCGEGEQRVGGRADVGRGGGLGGHIVAGPLGCVGVADRVGARRPGHQDQQRGQEGHREAFRASHGKRPSRSTGAASQTRGDLRLSLVRGADSGPVAGRPVQEADAQAARRAARRRIRSSPGPTRLIRTTEVRPRPRFQPIDVTRL